MDQLATQVMWCMLVQVNTLKMHSWQSLKQFASCLCCVFVCFLWRCDPTWAIASSFLRFLDYTQRRVTFGRTPLDAWSARRRDLYLTTHNTHNRQTSMPPVGFEPTISESERPQTYALDRGATWTGYVVYYTEIFFSFSFRIRTVHLDTIKVLFIHKLVH